MGGEGPCAPPGLCLLRALGEGAGFYLETGVHLMIPGRWSFIGNIYYRYLTIPTVWELDQFGNGTGTGPVLDENDQIVEIDWSGIGIRLGLQIDILDRF